MLKWQRAFKKMIIFLISSVKSDIVAEARIGWSFNGKFRIEEGPGWTNPGYSARKVGKLGISRPSLAGQLIPRVGAIGDQPSQLEVTRLSSRSVALSSQLQCYFTIYSIIISLYFYKVFVPYIVFIEWMSYL